nr:unnamed protein product [Spirometra erinaceieuropaei]
MDCGRGGGGEEEDEEEEEGEEEKEDLIAVLLVDFFPPPFVGERCWDGSEEFAVTNGVKQDGALTPTLYIHMLSLETYGDERRGVLISHKTDGQLLNQRWMHSSRVRPQLPSINLSSPTITLSTPPPKRTYEGAWINLPPPPPRQLWHNHQREEYGGYASAATQCCLQCISKYRERHPTASREHFYLPGTNPFSQHKNRQ